MSPCIHDPDVLFNVEVTRSRSGAFLFLTSGSFTSDETWLLDAADPGVAPRLVVARQPELEYAVDHGGDWLYLLTNRDGAQELQDHARAGERSGDDGREWILHRDDVFVEGVDVFRDFAVVEERQDGLRRLRMQARR